MRAQKEKPLEAVVSNVQNIAIEKLRRRHDARPVNLDAVTALAESIEAVGLMSPLRVRLIGEEYEIISGSHRFAACDSLDHREIACIVVESDDLHAELAMIDENLCRAELSPSDRASQTARRKAIYEELHPATKHGGNLEGGGVAKFATPEIERFTKATAQVTGQSERLVQLNAERGEKVIPEVIDMIRGTKLDTGSYLDKIKGLRPDEQVTAAKRDLAHLRGQERDPARTKSTPTCIPLAEEQFSRFVKLADEMMAMSVNYVISGAGQKRAILGQRASSLIDHLSNLMEGLDQ